VLNLITTVVGSFPIKLKGETSFLGKLKSNLGLNDPYKIAIEDAVKLQLEEGIDIISDGAVRGDMIESFVKHIPGFTYQNNISTITSKIRTPPVDITVKDMKYAMSVLDNELKNSNLSDEDKKNKGVKGIITGPSTIVYSSRIESFYKDKNSAIIDLAHALKKEVKSIDDNGAKYIQIDEPFLSTGIVDLKNAKEAISILSEDIEIPVAMHVCGDLTNVFKDLIKFPIDLLDCEFAGNNTNINILEKNSELIHNKKIGFGCVDSASNTLDNAEEVKTLIQRGINAVGKDNLILDPDCGLRKIDLPIVRQKLSLMSDLAKQL